MFSGVYTALITPFLKNKQIDWQALKVLLKIQQESGVDGVVLLGTTAEECTLTDQECQEIIKLAQSILISKKIIVGVSGNNTQKVVEKICLYNQFNIYGYLVGTPYYNKPTTKGLVKHFSKVASATTKPIMLYNIPSRCAVSLDFSLLEKLSKFANIIAIKEASGDINYATKLIAKFKNRYNILCGNDNMLLPMLAIGASGCVSVSSNFLPSLPINLSRNYNKDMQKCIFLHNKFNIFDNILFLETNPMCIKYIMSKYGLCNNVLREPLCSIKPSTKRQIDKVLVNLFNDFRL